MTAEALPELHWHNDIKHGLYTFNSFNCIHHNKFQQKYK